MIPYLKKESKTIIVRRICAIHIQIKKYGNAIMRNISNLQMTENMMRFIGKEKTGNNVIGYSIKGKTN